MNPIVATADHDGQILLRLALRDTLMFDLVLGYLAFDQIDSLKVTCAACFCDTMYNNLPTDRFGCLKGDLILALTTRGGGDGFSLPRVHVRVNRTYTFDC
jgi:hypothetical protein